MTYDRNGALRVGLLMDSFTLPAWAYEVLATLQQSAYARIQLIVLNDSFRAEEARGVLEGREELECPVVSGLQQA